MTCRPSLVSFAALASSLFAAGVHAASPHYVLKDLGTDFVGVGVNSAGQVAGTSVFECVLVDGNTGTMTHLGIPGGGTNCQAVGINEAGQVAAAVSDDTSTHAWVWTAGTWTDRTPDASAYPYAINGKGDVTGWQGAGAFKTRGTVVKDLGVLSSALYGCCASGYAINDHGDVAGTTGTAHADQYDQTIIHAFRDVNSTMVDITPDVPLGNSYATGINLHGHVIGAIADVRVDQYARYGFLWRDGVRTMLGGLQWQDTYGQWQNSGECRPEAINFGDLVVGQCGDDYQSNGSKAAFYFDGNVGIMIPIRNLLDRPVAAGWDVYDAMAVSRDRRILARAFGPDRHAHQVLLTRRSD